jgi:hypothetical protein
LEGKLKEALLELSSSQLIIKLLNKELNEATAVLTPARGANTEREICEEESVS